MNQKQDGGLHVELMEITGRWDFISVKTSVLCCHREFLFYSSDILQRLLAGEAGGGGGGLNFPLDAQGLDTEPKNNIVAEIWHFLCSYSY